MIQFLRCSSAFSILLIGSLSSILTVPASAVESQERSPSALHSPLGSASASPTLNGDISGSSIESPTPPMTEKNLPTLTFNQGNAKDLTPLSPVRINNLSPSEFKSEPSEGINLLVLRSLARSADINADNSISWTFGRSNLGTVVSDVDPPPLKLHFGSPSMIADLKIQDPPVPSSAPTSDAPFTLPKQGPGFKRSRVPHCDALEHLKTPQSYRRLDAYPRPAAFLPEVQEGDLFHRDYLTGNWGGLRSDLYEAGYEFYGCWGIDFGQRVLDNNSKDPNITKFDNGSPPNNTQFNYTQIYGLDIFSRAVSKDWQGGQLHISSTWPQAQRPLSHYGNSLNFNGTGQIHGHFYTDAGLTRGTTDQDQGIRLFELWFQQQYGYKQLSHVRVGNIFPMITFNKSILTGLFNFWTFTEPCMLGTTHTTGHAPCYPVAPFGLQVDHILNDNWEIEAHIMDGFFDPNGKSNRDGLRILVNDPQKGIEAHFELTYKGGTYSLDPKDNGLPWYAKIGWQHHTGMFYDALYDINGGVRVQTNQPPREVYGNSQVYFSYEGMLYREPGSYSKGLTMFAKAGTNFYNDRNGVRTWYVLGFGYEGLIPGRDRDVLYAGWGRVHSSTNNYQRIELEDQCQLVPGCKVVPNQDILEAGYSMQITPWYTLNPFVQYLINPDYRSDLGNIIVVGITSRIAF